MILPLASALELLWLLSVHVDALRKAGFAEVGTLWQRGDNRLLCAVLGGAVPS